MLLTAGGLELDDLENSLQPKPFYDYCPTGLVFAFSSSVLPNHYFNLLQIIEP